MNTGPIRSLVILGGGTAGWLAAAYLQRALPSGLEITVVESDRVPRIGVGEATVPTLRSTLSFLGLEEADWIPKTGASFKNAIKFVNWNHGPGKPDTFYHPFHHQRNNLVDLYGLSYFMEIDGRLPLGHYWLEEMLAGRTKEAFAYACSPNSRLCDELKAPRSLENPGRSLNYAYHFDARLFAETLRDLSLSRGVKRVVADYQASNLLSNGFISSLELEGGRRVEGDFFLDASGFRSLLLGKTMRAPFVNQNKYLLCDSAVALQPEYENRSAEFEPFTSSIARSAGWQWNIPLQHRRGTGYVFSSQFLDRAKAEAELREAVGEERCAHLEPNHIDMRVGYTPEIWSKNCLGIGLAGSFVEPLESTGIFLVEFGLFQLVRNFPDRSMSPGLRNNFNRAFRECYEEIRDFVVMHYALSKRNDTPFWPAAREPERIPDSLAAKLELFRERLPIDSDVKHHLFHAFNYTCLLAGFGALPEKTNLALHHNPSGLGQQMLEGISRQTGELSRQLPRIADFCEGLKVLSAQRKT